MCCLLAFTSLWPIVSCSHTTSVFVLGINMFIQDQSFLRSITVASCLRILGSSRILTDLSLFICSLLFFWVRAQTAEAMYLGWSLFNLHLLHKCTTITTTTPRLFKEKKKSDYVNAITWVNEWFLKDWIRPNTTLRVKLIITAKSRGKRGVQLVCTLTEAHISISIPTHLGIWDKGSPAMLLWWKSS